MTFWIIALEVLIAVVFGCSGIYIGKTYLPDMKPCIPCMMSWPESDHYVVTKSKPGIVIMNNTGADIVYGCAAKTVDAISVPNGKTMVHKDLDCRGKK